MAASIPVPAGESRSQLASKARSARNGPQDSPSISAASLHQRDRPSARQPQTERAVLDMTEEQKKQLETQLWTIAITRAAK